MLCACQTVSFSFCVIFLWFGPACGKAFVLLGKEAWHYSNSDVETEPPAPTLL